MANPANLPRLSEELPNILEKSGRKAAIPNPSKTETGNATARIAAYLSLYRATKYRIAA
jgi:hypothetical protein